MFKFVLFKKILILPIVLFISLSLSGCKKKTDTTPTDPTPTPTITVTKTPSKTPTPTEIEEEEILEFKRGARVKVSRTDGSGLSVRENAGTDGGKLGVSDEDDEGEIIYSSPMEKDDFTWWKIEWDNGLKGWSVEEYLELIPKDDDIDLLRDNDIDDDDDENDDDEDKETEIDEEDNDDNDKTTDDTEEEEDDDDVNVEYQDKITYNSGSVNSEVFNQLESSGNKYLNTKWNGNKPTDNSYYLRHFKYQGTKAAVIVQIRDGENNANIRIDYDLQNGEDWIATSAEEVTYQELPENL